MRARKLPPASPMFIQLLSSPSEGWDKNYISGFLEYWQKLGTQIGKSVPPIPVPDAASEIWNRADRRAA